jgi:hypothetical protein
MMRRNIRRSLYIIIGFKKFLTKERNGKKLVFNTYGFKGSGLYLNTLLRRKIISSILDDYFLVITALRRMFFRLMGALTCLINCNTQQGK